MMIGQQYYVASEATLKVENLSKLYVSSMAKVVSPRNVNFTVNKGEFVSLVGPSGRRKSTKIGKDVFNLLTILSREFKRTIIMVTHNPFAAATDRAIRIRDGSIEKEVVNVERQL
jgi:ABC-type lipoprotein export system ATPase subunit